MSIMFIPYEPWCSCCVRARALDNKHMKVVVTKCREFPVVSMDWCYLGQEGDPKTIPVLVVRDSQSKSTYSHATLGKGIINHEYGLHTIQAEYNLSYKRLNLKMDQELAARALQRRVKETWPGEAVVQNRPVGSSQSNDMVEKGIQEVEGQAQTLMIALQAASEWTFPASSQSSSVSLSTQGT